jgi:hypothetical protein
MRTATRFTLLLLALSLGAGCESEEDCPVLSGPYKPTYKKMFGSCGNFVEYRVCIESKVSGVYSCIESAFGNTVTTEIVFDGCRFDLDQEIEKNGVVVIYNEGYFDIESEDEASGRVNHTEYDSDGNITCKGTYEVELVSFEMAYQTPAPEERSWNGGTAGMGPDREL